MKSTTSFLKAVSLAVLAATAHPSAGCGPYFPIIPTPDFFALDEAQRKMSVREREENLKLWQSLTSERIPLSDIEDAVYTDTQAEFMSHMDWEDKTPDNLFYTYLRNTNDTEIKYFLRVAKTLEERRSEMTSPWYYPRTREYTSETGDFDEIIRECLGYRGERLKDRYALQTSRALFAARRYSDCITYTDSAFASVSDDNLMKRMAIRYAAGSLRRLGDKKRADSVFAMAGDIWSISDNEPVEYISRLNPGAPQLMDYIRGKAADTTFMPRMVPVAEHLLKDRRVVNKGDWNFLLAYVDFEYNDNPVKARTEALRAEGQSFSSDELKDLARAYRMKLDAETGHAATLLQDLRWIEGKADSLNPDANEWIRRCCNIVYAHWIPRLWKSSDYSTAILLCAYADNLAPSIEQQTVWEHCTDSESWWGSRLLSVSIDDMRDSETYINTVDYGCLSFQLAGSLTHSRLASAYARISGDKSALYTFLRHKARTDSDYYNELIGTLALREENYHQAVKYLSKVSEHYMKTMNVDKGGFLSREAFHPDTPHHPASAPGAKLDFARKMLSYRNKMTNAGSADERGLARLMYAIGRRNSFEDCWALTQYWRGVTDMFYPSLQYWYDDFADKNYAFLYDYDTEKDSAKTEELYQREVKAALDMLSTDEARAKAQYILGNLKTIVKRYPGTTTAEFVRSSCDNWESWI
ncbi:MAG: hypothetical protein K2J38_03905 [Muribaculaceae bacterium]|nr:hypothetical protein [Muribaculaceae bacterium]